ncbi:MAG: glycoside hydrolase family 26 protein, partial [Bifidobacteriaceae bacterium]|nr:glycoside hydrolase family 26 protein [Bifidobacteriaceae bacterium]
MRKLSILAALVPLALVSSALASVPAANADDPLPVPVNGRPAVDASAFPTANLKIADDAAIPAAQSLFAYLKGLGSAGYTLFGHEGDTSSAVVNNEAAAAPGTWDGVVSDTRRATGALPGIVGFNVGYPGWGDPAAPIRAAYEQGVVIELSDHVGNFAADDIWGRWGYGVSTTPINPVEQVLPGAAKHFELTAYLDRVAQFADLLRDSDGELIPVIYRPWHEHNGDWFWWDTSNATEGELAELFRFTVHYLRDIKGVHNFLYAFSPNGHFENQAEYLYAYPGDDYIDILGVDTYDDVPVANPDWFAQALKDLQIVVTYANQTGKIAAMTETGVRYDAGGHGWRLTDPDYPTDWFTAMADMIRNDPIAKQISYWLLWANFDTGQFWVPFKDHAAYGNHHMLPDFIRMYNKDSMVFADRTGDFASLVPDGQDKAVKKGPAIAIHTPEFKDYVSGTRTVYVEANPRLTPCVHAFAGACADSPARTASPAEVSVTLGGVTVAAAPGDNNLWTAEIDTTEVPDGRVALSARAVYSATTFSHVYAARAEDSHDVFIQNTAPAPNADPYLIDDFESYDSTDDNRTDVERVWWRTSDVMNALRLRNSDDTYPADHWLSQAWSTGLDTGAVLRIKYDVVPKNGAHPETAVTKTYPAAARPDWSQANSFSAIVQPDGKGHFLKFRITVGAGNENAYECNVNAEPGSGYNPALVAPQRVAVPIGCFESLADGAPVAGAALGAVQTVEIRIEQDPAVG